MKLFLISQDEYQGWDTYDSAVVCAPDEDTARQMDPGGKEGAPFDFEHPNSLWCVSADEVHVQLIGEAVPGLPLGVVCASFNAG